MALFWRVFPWNPGVVDDSPFSPSCIPPTTGRGRFDLPVACSPVLYLAESPEHAIAEALQPWRNRPLREAHLRRAGHPLALVSVQLDADAASEILDLCDPATLDRRGIAPDQVASRNRRATQAIAASAWDGGKTGLRWWSAFGGEWHGIVLFTDRTRDGLRYGGPRVLSARTPALYAAAAALGMPMAVSVATLPDRESRD